MKRKHERPRIDPKTWPPLPKPPSLLAGLDALDRWHLECLTTATEHVGAPPCLRDIATWMDRSHSAVHQRLSSLEARGYLARDDRRRFVRTRKAVTP
jgi:hypothetical protein